MSNKILLLPSVFLIAILLSSATGWLSGAIEPLNNVNQSPAPEWRMPDSQGKSLVLFNNQLTQLKIWGQLPSATETANQAVNAAWTLVGIISENDRLIALIEVNNELSIRRVALNEFIVDDVTITAIAQDSITVSDGTKETRYALYE